MNLDNERIYDMARAILMLSTDSALILLYVLLVLLKWLLWSIALMFASFVALAWLIKRRCIVW